MTDYTYTVTADNYTENVTFKLKKGDILKIVSKISGNTGYGIYGKAKTTPTISIPDYSNITGITINNAEKLSSKKFFFNITITASDVNKNFEIINYEVNSIFLYERIGGSIKIQIDTTNIKIKVNNSYIDGSPKIKINGNWTDGSAYVKIDGSWRK